MKHLEYRGYNAVTEQILLMITRRRKSGARKRRRRRRRRRRNKLSSKDINSTKSVKRLTAKLKIVEFVLKKRYDTFFTDVIIIVAFHNFMPELIKTSEKNLWLRDGQEVNTGFYFMRKKSSTGILDLKRRFSESKKPRKSRRSESDQCHHEIFSAKFYSTPDYANGCFMKTDAGRAAVASGHVKAVHVNCAQSKVVKHKIMCRRVFWFFVAILHPPHTWRQVKPVVCKTRTARAE